MRVFPKEQISKLPQDQIEKFILMLYRVMTDPRTSRREKGVASRNRTNCYIELERNRR